MTNKPKAKGTGGETELLRLIQDKAFDFEVTRTSPGKNYDLNVEHFIVPHGRMISALATRPDNGRWLVTVELPPLLELLNERGWGMCLEVKRYKKFAHHSIFESKFPRA